MMKTHLDTALMHKKETFSLYELEHTANAIACKLRKWTAVMNERLQGWEQRHRTRQQLSGLDRDALKDIGVSRADALQEASKPFWQE